MLFVLIDTNVLISGLLFAGNEQRLLEAGIRGKIRFLIPESVRDETLTVLKRKTASPHTFELFSRVLGASELIPLHAYERKISDAENRIRDATDSPILAAVLAVPHDFFVSGDRDFTALNLTTHITVKKLLERLKPTDD
ncbi:MAG: putative toxin-antitoxin system toxin component, PIN family [Candidatus Diapherotrites archaeon]|nr:putative toxin-antitoxin system toxin component, PIN family [Candidatus Diapherotrites archaeon]